MEGKGREDRMRGWGGQEGMRTQREESGREGEAKRRRRGEDRSHVKWTRKRPGRS